MVKRDHETGLGNRTGAAALLATQLVACGGPGTTPLLPGVDGEVVEEGRPVADLTVAITGDPDDLRCRERSATASTGPDGRFTLPATLARSRIAVRNPADAVVDWRLCFERAGFPPVAWNGYSVGASHAPVLVELRCDLALAEDERCTKTKTVWE